MNSKLQFLYDELERDRTTLLGKVSTFSSQRLSFNPIRRKWSVDQILMHLLTSEQLTLTYLKKKSLGIDQLANAGLIESAKLTLLQISQRLPLIKYKAPKVVVENTPNTIPLPDLIKRWSLLRLDLKNFLETIEEKNLHKLIYKHPVVGRLDVVQCLTFLREHFHHHLPQIERLL